MTSQNEGNEVAHQDILLCLVQWKLSTPSSFMSRSRRQTWHGMIKFGTWIIDLRSKIHPLNLKNTAGLNETQLNEDRTHNKPIRQIRTLWARTHSQTTEHYWALANLNQSTAEHNEKFTHLDDNTPEHNENSHTWTRAQQNTTLLHTLTNRSGF